jgi:hypothetical protein
MGARHRQRGWVGLIVILLALVIVGMLAQTLLKQYGLLPSDRDATTTAGPRGVGPTTPMSADPTTTTPALTKPLERARGLESSLQQQTEEMGKRIDAQTQSK